MICLNELKTDKRLLISNGLISNTDFLYFSPEFEPFSLRRRLDIFIKIFEFLIFRKFNVKFLFLLLKLNRIRISQHGFIGFFILGMFVYISKNYAQAGLFVSELRCGVF